MHYARYQNVQQNDIDFKYLTLHKHVTRRCGLDARVPFAFSTELTRANFFRRFVQWFLPAVTATRRTKRAKRLRSSAVFYCVRRAIAGNFKTYLL